MEMKLTFDDVLIVPKFSDVKHRGDLSVAPSDMTLGLQNPIISANMSTITEIDMVNTMFTLGGAGILHRNIPKDVLLEYLGLHPFSDVPNLAKVTFIAVGTVEQDKDRIDLIIDAHYTRGVAICVDIAHGHSQGMKDTLNYIRNTRKFGGIVIAGNVCTREATKDLFVWGASVVKVGIGSGSVCTTRLQTGCGYPQLTAIMECSEEGPIIADGGIRTAGDVCKALAAGASYVMIGGMLAGTDKTPGYKKGKEFVYRGMASLREKQGWGRSQDYVEGVSVLSFSRKNSSTKDVVDNILDGIRSCMSYVGANSINELQPNVGFVRVSNSAILEGRPHFEVNNDN